MALLEGVKEQDKTLYIAKEGVHSQARVHMSRDGLSKFLDVVRPNEDDGVKKWRKDNARRTTRGGVNSFFALVSRLFTNSGMKINEVGLKLGDYLKDKPFQVGNRYMGLFNWFYNHGLWDCTIDPNGIFVFWPDKPKGTYANKSVPVKPKTKFFKFSQDKGYIDYNGENWRYFAVSKSNEAIKILDSGMFEHWLVNETKIAVYEDILDGQGKEITVLRWEYQHNIGKAPLTDTVSKTSELEYGQTLAESILNDYFEPADESVSRFNNAQAVAAMHDFPIRMMLANILGLQCKLKNCNAGSEKVGAEPCKGCKGSGFDLSKLGAMSTLIWEEKAGMDNPTTSAPITYATPDPANINNSFDKSIELQQMANRNVGLDLLDKSEESGVARELRFEQIQDKLGSLALNCKMFLEQLLYFYEAYLEVNEGKRVTPIIYVPRVLKLKNAEILKEEAEKALPIDKQSAQMSFIEEKYMDDPNQVRSCRLAFTACPSLLLSESEMVSRTTQMIYGKWEWYKRDTIQPILYELIKANTDIEDKTVIDQALKEVRVNFAVVESENMPEEKEIVTENAVV